MSPSILDSVLASLPKQADPNVLVGFDTGDDAGVYLIAPDIALVQTVDFFTPIVDDPWTFGDIAATNSLSDVYAMGGRPVSALSIVGFPNTGRNLDMLEKILQGGLAKMQEAGCTVIGGHSIGDEEIKFGYAVTGVVDPKRMLTNRGARPGDRLVLTKRLGTGIISTALKKGKASDAAINASINSMRTLNRVGSEVAREFNVHAATDITGFGLLGHLHAMAAASRVSMVIEHTQVEFLPDALDYSRKGYLSGGLKNNAKFVSGCVEFDSNVPQEIRDLLFDPQTSGGLLLVVSGKDSPMLVKRLSERGVLARQVGRVVKKTSPLLRVE
ncbi:MAG: selenide, water dikinase SelD [Acidobacteria bacterium]|nr:MAG: selenide, water dikinase SelD [Acidobacteriota bacterium]